MAIEEAVIILRANGRSDSQTLTCPERLAELPCLVVAAADVANLAAAYQFVQGAVCFLEGSQLIVDVQQVEVDRIGAQSPQGLLSLSDDVFSAAATPVESEANFGTDFGGDDDLLPVIG